MSGYADDNVKDELQTQLLFIQNELAAERQKGAEGDSGKIAQLEQRRDDVQANLDGMEKKEITQKQAEYDGGLKEVIFQVFDAVIPVEAGNVAFGINDFQEKGETFRQMIDLAVDDNNATLHAYIAELLESKDAKIREQNALIIDLGVKLQESERKEQYATENYDRAVAENERLEQEVVTMGNAAADKDVEIADLNEQLKAKEEQIAKLTEEINKPKASGIILPNQAKPSATLQQMMDAAKNKSVKTQVELALTGENFRGKVLFTPPTLGGGETATETFHDEAAETIATGSGIFDSQAPVVDFRTEEGTTAGLDEHSFVSESDEPVTRKEFEELKHEVELLKQSTVRAA